VGEIRNRSLRLWDKSKKATIGGVGRRSLVKGNPSVMREKYGGGWGEVPFRGGRARGSGPSSHKQKGGGEKHEGDGKERR